MVHRAQRPGVGVGGHISTYASTASLYEVGFNHFFRGKDHPGGGDQVFFQGHASPGIYARAFLEGRLTERPARRLPPGALPPRRRPAVLPAPAADAGLLGVPDGVDGPRPDERDLPGAVQPLPARPRHQGHLRPARVGLPRRRRDGRGREPRRDPARPPARSSTTSPSSSTATCSASTARCAATARSSRSSSRSSAAPAGTSSRWCGAATGTPCSHADADGALVNLMNTTPDGDYQTYKANDGAYVREHFFGRDPRTQAGRELSDEEIWSLSRGGHDYRKVYAAYQAATEHKGQPTVILAKTIKGWTAGRALRGPQRDPPDEEADARGPQGLPRHAPHPARATPSSRPVPAAVLPPGPEAPRDPVHARAAPRPRRLRARSGAPRPSRWCCRATRSTTS